MQNGDTLAGVGISFGASASSTSPIGPYDISANVTAGQTIGNYLIGGITDGTLNISPATLNLTIDNQSMTYGASLPSFTGSADNLQNGDTLAGVGISFGASASSTSPIGPYDIAANVTVGQTIGNYLIGGITDGTLDISPATLNLTIDNQSITYGASLPSFTGSGDNLQNGDTLAGVGISFGASASSSSPVDTYDISANVTVGQTIGNYLIGGITDGTLTINAANLVIAADDQSMIYGDSSPTFSASATGLVNGDTFDSSAVTFSATASSSSNVGTSYSVTPIAWSSAAAGNYNITYTAGALSVVAANLVIAADDQTMTYGSSLPTFTATATGLVNNDTFDSTTVSYFSSASATSNVGDYAITPSAWSSAAAGNYDITYTDGTLSIVGANLLITANDQTMIYGGSLPTFTATATGLVNNDTFDSSDVTFSTTASPSSDIGTYPITPSAWSSAARRQL